MELNECRSLMLANMQLHGLDKAGWTFKWDRARKRLGSCDQYNKVITLSHILTPIYSEEKMYQTILHEIAHALVGDADRGHGRAWQAKARAIGYTEGRTHGLTEGLAPGFTPDDYYRITGIAKPARFEGAPALNVRYDYKPGDYVTFRARRGGNVTCRITRWGRTRYHCEDSNRGVWTVPMTSQVLRHATPEEIERYKAELVHGPTGKPSGPVDPRALSTVTFNLHTSEHPYVVKAPGEWFGTPCTIIKTGPKNHHVKVDKLGPDRLLIVPREYVVRAA